MEFDNKPIDYYDSLTALPSKSNRVTKKLYEMSKIINCETLNRFFSHGNTVRTLIELDTTKNSFGNSYAKHFGNFLYQRPTHLMVIFLLPNTLILTKYSIPSPLQGIS